MQFKKSNRFHLTTLYETIETELVLPDPYSDKELDITIPKYLIVKIDNSYNVYIIDYWRLERLQEYTRENIYQSSIYGTLYNFLSNYKDLWSGFKKLKDAKEYIQEYEKDLTE